MAQWNIENIVGPADTVVADDPRQERRTSSRRPNFAGNQPIPARPGETVQETRRKTLRLLRAWRAQTTGETGPPNDIVAAQIDIARTLSWGVARPMCYYEEQTHRAVFLGIGTPCVGELPNLRPVHVIGRWKLSDEVCVSAMLLSPALCTSRFGTERHDNATVSSARNRVVVDSPSTNSTDGCTVRHMYGHWRLMGRLASSVASVLESCGACESPHVAEHIHLAHSALVYCVACRESTHFCVASTETLQHMALCKPPSLVTMLEAEAIALYSSSQTVASLSGTTTFRASGSTLRVLANGAVRYMGTQDGVARAYRDLHNLVVSPMLGYTSAARLVTSLQVVDSFTPASVF